MPRVTQAKRYRVTAPNVSEPGHGIASNCFVVGDMVFLSGMTARDLEGKVTAIGDANQQAVCVLNRMKSLLEAAGGTMSDIVKLNCFLTDIRYRDDFVRARKEFFTDDFPPCTLIGGVSFTTPELLIEVDGFAVLGSSRALLP